MSKELNSSSSTTTTTTPLSAIAARRERQRLASQANSSSNDDIPQQSTPVKAQSTPSSSKHDSSSSISNSKKKKPNKKNLNPPNTGSGSGSPSSFIHSLPSTSNPFSTSSLKSRSKSRNDQSYKPASVQREEADSSQDEADVQDGDPNRFSLASQSLSSAFKSRTASTLNSKFKESLTRNEPSNMEKRSHRSKEGICSTFVPRFKDDEKGSRKKNAVRLIPSKKKEQDLYLTDSKGKQKEEQNLDDGEGLVLGMMKDETLIAVGMYSVQVLRGSILINGSVTEASNQPRIVLAPVSNPLPVIKSVSSSRSESHSSGIWNRRDSRDQSSSSSYNDLRDLIDFSLFDSVILVKSLAPSVRELNNVARVCSLAGSDPFSFNSSPLSSSSPISSTSTPNQSDSDLDRDQDSFLGDSSPKHCANPTSQSFILPGFKPILNPISSPSLSIHSMPQSWEAALESIEDHLINEPDEMGTENLYQDDRVHIDHEATEIEDSISRPGVFVPSFNHNYNDFGLKGNQRKQRKTPPLIVLVKGPKKVGKSTLARLSLERIISVLSSSRCDSSMETSSLNHQQETDKDVKDGGLKTKRIIQVCFLELDLGQGEFGPPGIIGLYLFSSSPSPSSEINSTTDSLPIISPNWCCSKIPIKSHFFGDTTPRDDPETYLRCIQNLLNCHRELCEREKNQVDDGSELGIPLVINTCGWSKGLGSDLLSQIENLSRPSHIFHLENTILPEPMSSSTSRVDNNSNDEIQQRKPFRGRPYLDHLGYESRIGPLVFSIESFDSSVKSNESNNRNSIGVGGGSKKLNQSDSRTICLMTYFHSTSIPCHRSETFMRSAGPDYSASASASPPPSLSTSSDSALPGFDFSKPLLSCKPYIIDIESGIQGGLHTLDFGSKVENRHKLRALNGSIVGIVLCRNWENSPNGNTHPVQSDPSLDVSMDPQCKYPSREETDQSEDRSDHSKWWRALNHPLPSIESSTCLGLGIIRSIDVTNHQIHLLTPVPLESIDYSSLDLSSATSSSHSARNQPKIALVKGILDLPVWASLDFKGVKAVTNGTLSTETYRNSGLAGVKVQNVPYLEWPEPPRDSSSFPIPIVGEPQRTQGGMKEGENGAQDEQVEEMGRDSANSAIHVVGNKKRKIRRNLMRRSQG